MTLLSPISEEVSALTPAIERRNGLIFVVSQLLIYFSAPVIYVGIVQAALCDKLGASATVANLPSTAYLFGAVAPLLAAWFFAERFDRRLQRDSFLALGGSILAVSASIFLPLSDAIRIVVVIAQGLLAGFTTSISFIYALKCLARGTTEQGRAWALKYAYGFGPVAAIAGSLVAQALLAEKIPGLSYPGNVALIYLMGGLCMTVCGWLAGRLQLLPAAAAPRQHFWDYLRESFWGFVGDRRLAFAWLAFLAWYFTLNSMPNLSLYAREATGRTPLELAGVILALRFGFKAIAGFGLGALAQRHGPRVPLLVAVVLVSLAILWPFFVSGYGYLLAFGLMGAGELGAVYFLNYAIAISPASATTRNLAFMGLTTPLSGLAPPLYGAITDRFGFHASFSLGVVTAALALVLILQTRRTPQPASV